MDQSNTISYKNYNLNSNHIICNVCKRSLILFINKEIENNPEYILYFIKEAKICCKMIYILTDREKFPGEIIKNALINVFYDIDNITLIKKIIKKKFGMEERNYDINTSSDLIKLPKGFECQLKINKRLEKYLLYMRIIEIYGKHEICSKFRWLPCSNKYKASYNNIINYDYYMISYMEIINTIENIAIGLIKDNNIEIKDITNRDYINDLNSKPDSIAYNQAKERFENNSY